MVVEENWLKISLEERRDLIVCEWVHTPLLAATN